jgi:hypothetical protein
VAAHGPLKAKRTQQKAWILPLENGGVLSTWYPSSKAALEYKVTRSEVGSTLKCHFLFAYLFMLPSFFISSFFFTSFQKQYLNEPTLGQRLDLDRIYGHE